jgi:LacI family transcriptional regulator
MPGSRPTLKDVALVAGVDPSLVSRVINGDDRVAIREETRERILEAIRSVGYRKNMVAQGLRMGRTGLLAYIVPDLTTPSYPAIIEGAEKRARKNGYTVLVATQPDAAGSATEFRRLLDEGRVDGLLLASGVIGDANTGALVAGGGPLVVVNRLVEGASCGVIPDDAAASALAAEHLVELGHRACAIVTGPSELDTTSRRSSGFTSALTAAGISGVQTVTAKAWSPEAGYDAARRLRDLSERPTAIFSAAGLLHVGLLAGLAEAGIDVPGQMSVIALHDPEINRYTSPPMTAVSMPLEEVGAEAVELLLRILDGKPTPATKVVSKPKPKLIRRGSTGPAPDKPSRKAA